MDGSGTDSFIESLREPRTRELVVFVVVCLLSCSLSGGTILGIGPFVSTLVREGFAASECDSETLGCSAQYNALSPIFNGGFQIMTGGTCLAGLLIPYTGPRLLAFSGLLISLGGRAWIATADPSTSVSALMVAYGMMGAGGNALYLASFGFAELLNRREMAISILSASFNVAGLMLMILTLGLTLKEYFGASCLFTVLAAILAAFIFPSRQYSKGDRWYCGRHTPQASHSGEVPQPQTHKPLIQAALEPEFIWFSFLVAWCSVCCTVVSGMAAGLFHSKSSNTDEVHALLKFAFPAISSSTFIFAPVAGWLIECTGFWLAMLLGLLATQAMLCSCFLPSLNAMLLSITLSTLVQAIVFTVQFSYISIMYPPALYGPLLSCCIGLQGILGLIAWPGLSPNPFGDTQFGIPLLGIMLPPTFILLYCPLQQYRIEQKSQCRDANGECAARGAIWQTPDASRSSRLSFSGFPSVTAFPRPCVAANAMSATA